MRLVCKYIGLATVGGGAYVLLELLWRGRSHWTMFLLGGFLFVVLGLLNEGLTWEMSLVEQAVIGACTVTMAELVAGLILNCWLGLGVWDYSGMPCNLWGQICLPYTLLWAPVSMVAIVLDDYLRWWFFGEETPHYHLVSRCQRKGGRRK